MKKGLIVQLIMAILLAILLIVSIFISDALIYAKLCAGATLIVMSINNHLYFQRKYFTFGYAFIGTLIIIRTILEFING